MFVSFLKVHAKRNINISNRLANIHAVLI